jgi:hypothetical protein
MGKLGSCQRIARYGGAKEQRDISEISSLTANSNPSPQRRAHNHEAEEFKEKDPAT